MPTVSGFFPRNWIKIRTVSDFRVDTAFPELGDIDCYWAPQTIYDDLKGRMMVYFTIRYNNKNVNLYRSCTDDAFTKMETRPEMISDISGIDGDITTERKKCKNLSSFVHLEIVLKFFYGQRKVCKPKTR